MTDYTLRTPQEWSEAQRVEILDPNGWRAADVPLDLPITLMEFQRYCASSTVRQLPGDGLRMEGDAVRGRRVAGGDERHGEG